MGDTENTVQDQLPLTSGMRECCILRRFIHSKYIPLLFICSFTLGKRNAMKEQRSAVKKFCSVVIQVPWHKVYKKLQRSQTQSYLSAGSENQWFVAACRFFISPIPSSSPAIIVLPIRKDLMGPYLKQKVTLFLLTSVSRMK